MNAAAAILAAGAAEDLAVGAARARESIDSGAARDVLSRLTKLTGDLASADE